MSTLYFLAQKRSLERPSFRLAGIGIGFVDTFPDFGLGPKGVGLSYSVFVAVLGVGHN
jgi:hypothetical protein